MANALLGVAMGSSLAGIGWQCSETGLDRAPDPGDGAHVLGALGLLGEQALAGLGIGVDRRVLADVGVHQRRGSRIAVGVVDEVGNLGLGLRLQQKLDEAVSIGRVRRVFGDVEVVEPDQRAFLGDEKRQLDGLFRFYGTGLGGGVVT